MSQLSARETGAVGLALTEARAFAGIIADGHHVGDEALAVALRMKGPARLMLVTDAMSVVGDPENRDGFTLFGRPIHRAGDRLAGADGTLAGSALTMVAAVRHMTTRVGAKLEEALAMAALTQPGSSALTARSGGCCPATPPISSRSIATSTSSAHACAAIGNLRPVCGSRRANARPVRR